MTNSLYITVPFFKFATAYIDSKTTRCPKAIMFCLNSFKECFMQWERDFITDDYQNNINLVTLFKLIAIDNKPKASLAWKIESYRAFLKSNNIRFKDHLDECFLMHLVKDTIVYSSYKKDYKLLYFLAQEIKFALFKLIRKICQQAKRDYSTNPTKNEFDRSSVTINTITLELDFLSQQNPLLSSMIHCMVTENLSWKQLATKYKLTTQETKKYKGAIHQWISKVL
jgi:hypothetical protein